MNDHIIQMSEQLVNLKQIYEQKKEKYREEMKTDCQDCLTNDQSNELAKDLVEITKLDNQVKREKANQEFQNKAICISNNPKAPSSEQQSVTDTSQTN